MEWIILGGLLVLGLLVANRAGAANAPTGEIYPAINSMVTLLVRRPGAEQPAYSLSPQITNEIVNAFATRGYRVLPIANGGRPTGAVGSYLRDFQVTTAAANIGVPVNLGPGLTIVSPRPTGAAYGATPGVAGYYRG